MIIPTSQPPARRAGRRIGVWRSVSFLVALTALLIHISQQNRGPRIGDVITADALDDQYRPIGATEVYASDDTFYVSVEIDDYRADDPVAARWQYGGEVIATTPLEADLYGGIYAGFVLANEALWPEGRYRVDILYGEDVLGGADFRVDSAPDE